jgi:hypothetical protein
MAEAEQSINDLSDKTGQTGQTRQDQTGQISPAVHLASFNEILIEAWRSYRLKLKNLLGITIIPALASIAFLIIAIIFGGLLAAIAAITNGAYAPIAIVLGVIFGIFAIIALLYLAFWGQIALLYNVGSDETVGAIESYKRTRGKIWDYAWIAFLVGVSTLCGYVLFIVPGIIFSIFFSFAAFAFLFENEKGMNALLKSREYVRGKWWGVLFRLWAMAGLFVLLSWVFSLFSQGFQAAKAPGAIQTVIAFIEQITMFILAPLQTVFVYKTFTNLKTVKRDMVFTPSRRTEKSIIITGILGGIVLIAAIVLSAVGIAALSQSGIDLESLLSK